MTSPQKQEEVFREFNKFLKKDVTVRYLEGNKVVELRGVLKFMDYFRLTCVIMTEEEKVIVTHVISITRTRNKND